MKKLLTILFIAGLVLPATMASADVIDTLLPKFRLVGDDLMLVEGLTTDGQLVTAGLNAGWVDRAQGIIMNNVSISPTRYPLLQQVPTLLTGPSGNFNGHASARFEKANAQMLIERYAPATIFNASAQTMIVVFEKRDINGALVLLYKDNDWGNTRGLAVGQFETVGKQGVADALCGDDASWDGAGLSGTVMADGKPYWAMLDVNAGVITSYLNGVWDASMVKGPIGAGFSVGIGGRELNWKNIDNFLEGDIADVIIFDRVLSAGDKAIVDAFIVSQYGIPEPATMVLLGLGGLGLLRRKMR